MADKYSQLAAEARNLGADADVYVEKLRIRLADAIDNLIKERNDEQERADRLNNIAIDSSKEATGYAKKCVALTTALQDIDGTAYAGLTGQMSETATLKSISIHARDVLAR